MTTGVALLSQSDFTYALRYNPANVGALCNLGLWFAVEQFNGADYTKALGYLNQALALRPGSKGIILNRAIVKIKAGDKSGCDDLRQLHVAGYPDAERGLKEFCAG